MTGAEQMALWVAGDARCPNDDGECCLDFSCCGSEMMPVEARKAYALACATGDENAKNSAMLEALAGAFPEAYVVGREP